MRRRRWSGGLDDADRAANQRLFTAAPVNRSGRPARSLSRATWCSAARWVGKSERGLRAGCIGPFIFFHIPVHSVCNGRQDAVENGQLLRVGCNHGLLVNIYSRMQSGPLQAHIKSSCLDIRAERSSSPCALIAHIAGPDRRLSQHTTQRPLTLINGHMSSTQTIQCELSLDWYP